MGQLAGQRGSFRAGQRGAADGAAGRARSKLDSHLPQPTALSPARLLRCAATWLRKKKPLPSKTHSKRCASVCSLCCFRGLSIAIALIGGPPRGGQLCRCWPRGGGLCGMFARLCRGVASRAPRYALARAPARGMQGLPAGESASLLPLRLGLGRQGERGRRRHPRGCRAPWSRRSPPPTRGCRRWARRISPSRSLSRSCLLTPRAQVRPSQAVQEHAGRTPSEPAATLREIGPRPPPRMCQATPSPPSRCRYRATSSQRPARGWKGACSAVWGAALSVQASRLWTGGSRCPRRPSS